MYVMRLNKKEIIFF